MSAALLALADRCEAAAAEDEALSLDIWEAVGRPAEYLVRDLKLDPPDYTASLDAAMTLVPEGYGWRLWVSNSEERISHGFPNLPGVTMWGNGREYAPSETRAATPALALCAAALRARDAQ